MIALLYPFIIIFLVLCSAFAAYKRRSLICLILVTSCFYINHRAKVFAVFFSNSSVNVGNLKVMTFNINASNIATDRDIENLFNLIVSQEADILFLAEDFEPVGEKLNALLISRYPYTTYVNKTDWGGHYFYSKYSLGMDDHIDIKSNRFSYCFHCNMEFGKDTISFFGCHLASNNYKANAPSIRPENINGLSSLNEYICNIELAKKQRIEEVVCITEHPFFNNRSIVLGDFNDVCGSKPIGLLEKAGLKDAWWEKGFGYGATVSHPLPYRIDHILYREGLKLKNIRKIDTGRLSDHDALIATFKR